MKHLLIGVTVAALCVGTCFSAAPKAPEFTRGDDTVMILLTDSNGHQLPARVSLMQLSEFKKAAKEPVSLMRIPHHGFAPHKNP